MHTNRAWLRLIWLVYLMLGATSVVHAVDPAGKILFVTGEAQATGVDGVQRILERGDPVLSGELLATGKGSVQVRFTDGATVALRAFSQFRIDEYRYAGAEDGSERAIFSLLKGGLRTLTGAVGRINRKTYRVDTFAAGIGIRGTGYQARVCQGDCSTERLKDGVHVTVSQGAVSLANDAGELELTAGQQGFVADFSTPPSFVTPAGSSTDPTASDAVPEIGIGEQLDPDASGHALPEAAHDELDQLEYIPP